MEGVESDDAKRWYVMRDLTRHNAAMPAYRLLGNMGIDIFTPMVPKIHTRRNGERACETVPFMHDLLFVHDTRKTIDPIVDSVSTFQYRYLKGRVPMTVRTLDMDRFIAAVNSTEHPRYYSIGEITPGMRRRHVRIIGGPLDGVEGCLLAVHGSKEKRLLVELPSLLAAVVDVTPRYIELI